MLKIGKIKNVPTTLAESGDFSVPHYVIAEDLDLNIYNDITSNNNWIDLGKSFYDYLECRNQIKIRTATIGIDKLSVEEIKCASQYFCIAKANRDLVHTESEQKIFWEQLISQTQKTRLDRWVIAKSYISYILSPAYSTDLALSTETLSKNFVEYGIESLAVHGVNGLFDWLNTTYTSKPYYNQIHRDNILSILIKGSY